MSKPEGILKKTKDNSRKKYNEAKDFAEGKRLGRPKQQWVPSMFNGEPLPDEVTMADIERMVTEETIANKTFVSAHWEKVTLNG